MLSTVHYDLGSNEELLLTGKSGMDGSGGGGHKARHQLVDAAKSLEENPHLNPDTYKNYLLTCFCPLELSSVNADGSNTVIWKNESPNSITYTRPLSLIRASECRDVIESEFSGLFEEIMSSKEQVSAFHCSRDSKQCIGHTPN